MDIPIYEYNIYKVCIIKLNTIFILMRDKKNDFEI